MSDTEVSLSAAECREYILDLVSGVWDEELASIASRVQVEPDPIRKKRYTEQLEEFRQAEQWLKAKLGC